MRTQDIDNLFTSTKLLYKRYLALELMHTLKDTNGHTLAEFVVGKQDGVYSFANLLFTIQNGEIKFPQTNSQAQLKSQKDYDLLDLQMLLSGTKWKLNSDNKLFTSIPVNGNEQIIGGNFDLYKLHIVNLSKILCKLVEYKTNPTAPQNNWLVSITTGSGKTFTQALWWMVNQDAGTESYFVVPDSLKKQYLDDYKRLFPSFDDSTAKNIMSYSEFFALSDSQINPDATITFDESHLLVNNESQFLRAQELAQKHQCLFLTATPTPSIYELSQKKDKSGKKLERLVTMSNAEKVREGYSEEVRAHESLGTTILSKWNPKKWIADLLDPNEPINLATNWYAASLYTVNTKIVETDQTKSLRDLARWNLQLSGMENELVLANHFEDIVNIESAVTGEFCIAESYYNKNLYNRYKVYAAGLMLDDKFQSPEALAVVNKRQKYHDDYEATVKAKLREIKPNAQDQDIDNLALNVVTSTSTNTQYEHLSKVAIIDTAIAILLGVADPDCADMRDIHEKYQKANLDKMRQADLNGLVQKCITAARDPNFQQKLKAFNMTYDSKTNKSGFHKDDVTAIRNIVLELRSTLNNTAVNSLNKEKLVDNWGVDLNKNLSTLSAVKKQIQRITTKRYKQFLFSQNVEANEGIKENVVYSAVKLNKTTPPITPKKRKKRAVESMDPKYREYQVDCVEATGMNETMADTYSKWGIASLYVTDKKIEGFSNKGLQKASLFVHAKTNRFAEAASVKQAFGRLRGLDHTKSPNFFVVTPEGTQLDYGTSELNKEDDAQDYIRAIRNRKSIVINELANELGDQILDMLLQNPGMSDSEIATHVNKLILEKLQVANRENTFHFDITAQDSVEIVRKAQYRIEEYCIKVENGNELSGFTSAIAALLYFVARIVQYFESKKEINSLERYHSPEYALLKKLIHLNTADCIANETIFKAHMASLLDITKHRDIVESILKPYLSNPQAALTDTDNTKLASDELLKIVSEFESVQKVFQTKYFYNSLLYLNNFTKSDLAILLGNDAQKGDDASEAIGEMLKWGAKKGVTNKDRSVLDMQYAIENHEKISLVVEAYQEIARTQYHFYTIRSMENTQNAAPGTPPPPAIIPNFITHAGLDSVCVGGNPHAFWKDVIKLRAIQYAMPATDQITRIKESKLMSEARRISSDHLSVFLSRKIPSEMTHSALAQGGCELAQKIKSEVKTMPSLGKHSNRIEKMQAEMGI